MIVAVNGCITDKTMTNEINASQSIELVQIACLGDQKYPAFELRSILAYMKSEGKSDWCEQVLEKILLSEEELLAPFIPAYKALHALNELTDSFYRPGLGHEIAQTYTISDFAELGTCVSHCANLNEALHISNAYYDLVGSFNDLTHLYTDKTYTQRLVNVSGLNRKVTRFLFELTIGGLIKLGRELSGHTITLKTVRFDDVLSDDEKLLYSNIYQAKIEDAKPFNEWIIENKDLDIPINNGHLNPTESEHKLRQILSMLKEESGLVSDIDTILKGSAGDFPDPDMLAQALGVSSRTLRRRLSKLGTSYRELMDKVRCQLALNLIQNKGLSNEDIAAELGYSDAANFCNAFKKWTGYAPSHYRMR
jgi:AraC-like DNA-binding protein